LTKTILSGVMAATLGLMPVMASASSCFTESEWKAAHVRVLQTELQVTALECVNLPDYKYDTQYNAFIAKFSDRLQANASVFKAHFKRIGASDREMDRYVTKIANDASTRGMSSTTPCADAAPLFSQIAALDHDQLEQVALDHVTDKSEIGDLCSVKAPAKPGSGKKSTKKSVAKAQ
jgi:hypothetical protein